MPRKNNQVKHIRFEYKTCDHKRKYSTESEAKKTAEYQMLINPYLELEIYQCDLCLKWHLTSKKD